MLMYSEIDEGWTRTGHNLRYMNITAAQQKQKHNYIIIYKRSISRPNVIHIHHDAIKMFVWNDHFHMVILPILFCVCKISIHYY